MAGEVNGVANTAVPGELTRIADQVYVEKKDLAKVDKGQENGIVLARLLSGVNVQIKPAELEIPEGYAAVIGTDKGYTYVNGLKGKSGFATIMDTKGDDKIICDNCNGVYVSLKDGKDFVLFNKSERCTAAIFNTNKGSGEIFGAASCGSHPNYIETERIPSGFRYKAK